jgi:hypothetical protein
MSEFPTSVSGLVGLWFSRPGIFQLPGSGQYPEICQRGRVGGQPGSMLAFQGARSRVLDSTGSQHKFLDFF